MSDVSRGRTAGPKPKKPPHGINVVNVDVTSTSPAIAVGASAGLTVTAGSTAALTITITRSGGFAGAVNIMFGGLPAGVSASSLTIPAQNNSGTVTLTATSGATIGAAVCTITATAADVGVTSATTATTLTVVAPTVPVPPGITLAVPSTASLVQGGTRALSVTLTRVGGYTGAVTVTVTGQPTGVTASALTIASGATSGTVTLTATDTATLGGATLTLTATGAGVTDATGTCALTVTAPVVGGVTGTPVEAPLHALRVSPASSDPWFTLGGLTTAYGVRTWVDTTVECHVYRRPSGTYNGVVDYTTPVTLVAADTGVSVAITTTEDDGVSQVATARVCITGVTEGGAYVTLACGGVETTIRVIVGPKSTNGVLLPLTLTDEEYVPPSGDARVIAITDGASLATYLAGGDVRLGDWVQFPDGFDYDRVSGGSLAVPPPTGSGKGWLHLGWHTAAARTALGDGSAWLAPIGDATARAGLAMPRIRTGQTNTSPVVHALGAKFVRWRGMRFGVVPGTLSGVPVVEIGTAYWINNVIAPTYPGGDPTGWIPYINMTPSTTLPHHVVLHQCVIGDVPVPRPTHEGTIASWADDSPTGKTTIQLGAGFPTAAQAGKIVRIRKAGMPTLYAPSAPYVDSAKWLVTSYNTTTGVLVVEPIATPVDGGATPAWSTVRPTSANLAAGLAVEFLPAPTAANYPHVAEGLRLNGRHLGVVGCRIEGIQSRQGYETHGIIVFQGRGPYAFAHTAIVGPTGIHLFFGGSGALDGEDVRDVHTRHCYLSTGGEAPQGWGGFSFIKNFYEHKTGQRACLEHTRMRHLYDGDGSQFGMINIKTTYYAVTFDAGPRLAQATRHVTVRRNVLDQCMAFLQVMGVQSAGIENTHGTQFVEAYDNVLMRCLAGRYQPNARFVFLAGYSTDVNKTVANVFAYNNTHPADLTNLGGIGNEAIGVGDLAVGTGVMANRPLRVSIHNNVHPIGNVGGQQFMYVSGGGSYSGSQYYDDVDHDVTIGADGTSYGHRRNVVVGWTATPQAAGGGGDPGSSGQVATLARNIRVAAQPGPYVSGTDGSAGQFVGNPLTSTDLADYDIHPSCTALRAIPAGETRRPGATIADVITALALTPSA